MINSFINKVNYLNHKEQNKLNYLFGFIFGLTNLFMAVIFYMRYFNLYYLFLIISMTVLGTVIINPDWIYYIRKAVNKIFNIIGYVILIFLLTFLYVIYVVPVGVILKIYKSKYKKNINSNFDEKEQFNLKLNKNRKFKTLKNLLSFFTRRELIIFLPFILILILIGLILIFVQSSYVSPFIYPLF